MAEIGKRSTLTVVRASTPGLYLDGGEMGEILLPGKYIPKDIATLTEVDVFVYRDSEDRLVATTETPLAMVGDFACLEVIGVNRHVGAFLNWGLSKDLLLPFREQIYPVNTGDKVVVHVYLDEKSERIVATTRLNRHLNHTAPNYKEGQEVDLLIINKSPFGYNAIVENAHRGLLYDSNLSAPLEIGQQLKGYVRKLRPDGKIDLSLDAAGYQRVAPLREQILKALETQGGHLNFDDNSSPQAIREVFGVSKKAFKQALGALYKARKITFANGGIQSVKK